MIYLPRTSLKVGASADIIELLEFFGCDVSS